MMRTLTIAAALALCAAPSAAQSLLGIRGLGVPQPPIDAAGRALGGVGVAVLGLNGSFVNPAASAGVRRRGALAAFESTARNVDFAGATDEAGSTRFPLIRVFVPFGQRWVLDVGYGGFMDQSWAVTLQDTLVIAGTDVPVRDVVDSRGGISQLRAGVSYALTPRFALGVAGGVYTGERDLRMTRAFDDTTAISNFGERTLRTYSGALAAVGMRWDAASFLRVGAALTWSSDLTMTETVTTDDSEVSSSRTLPLEFAAGASAILGAALTGTVGGSWAGWSAADGEGGAVAADAWRIGGGIEWEGPRLGPQRLPLRVGASTARLPFAVDGETPSEWSAALGAGLRFAGEDPLGRVDLTLERGSRSAGNLSEDFWRATIALSVFGR